MARVLQKILTNIFWNKIAVNVNRTSHGKNCLMLYTAAPFVAKWLSSGHQNQWQAVELARIIGSFGYNVDVINFDNQKARLVRKYDLVVDLHPKVNPVYAAHMAPDCVRIAYITGSNPEFSNRAEAARLDDLKRRRGVLLQQRRYVNPFPKEELESFDAMFFIGNSYNLSTYEGYNIRRQFSIRNNGIEFPDSLVRENSSPRNFLFLASGGQVHKGLDLLLEVFSRNKDLTLYVCSSFKSEKDFCRLYDHELFHCENIVPVGFVDVMGTKFRSIADKCGYVVLPSCSEANASSVLTGMSAGLVPIVSRECGFEDDEVHYFPDCSVETIAATVNSFAVKPARWLADEREKARTIVKTRYCADAYARSVQAALKGLLDDL